MNLRCCILALLSLVPLARAQTAPTDADLAARFRPFLKTSLDGLSNPEQYHPTSWQWYVGHSNLTESRGGGHPVILSSSGWDTGFSLLLTKGSDLTQVCQNFGNVDLGTSCHDVGLQLPLDTKISPDPHGGEDWASVVTGDGVYAHVERVGAPPRPGIPDTRLINIDYTIIWANNNPRGGISGGHLGQHDGDITFVIVLYDPNSDRLVRVTYPAHGCIIQLYELVPGQTAHIQNLQGQSIDTSTHPAKLSGDQEPAVQVDVALSNISSAVSSTECAVWGLYKRSDANHIFLVADPSSLDPRFEHPVVFVENGTHESWPNSTGRITDGGDHGGKGPSWLPATVTLLGSYAAPTTGNTPFLHYNGKFGTDGASEVLHRSWCWPHNDNWPATNKPNGECSQNNAGMPDAPQQSMFSDLLPYRNFGPVTSNGALDGIINSRETAGITAWPQIVVAPPADYYAVPSRQQGNGSSSLPYGGLDVALTFVPAGSTLHLGAGTYSATLLTKPLTLQPTGEPVLLGN